MRRYSICNTTYSSHPTVFWKGADDQSVRKQDVTELLAHLVNTASTAVSHNARQKYLYDREGGPLE
jgi:hypothetical protein